MLAPNLNGNRYVLKRQLLRVFGRGFGIYDGSNNLVLQADEAFFRIREEIRLSAGLGESIGIFARGILMGATTYDVVDLTNGTKIGAFRRQWLKSLARDEWDVLDPFDQPIGTLIEDRMDMALIRRFLVSLVPQNYDLFVGGRKVVDLRQNFNPFTYHLNIDFLTSPLDFDRRLGISAAVLLGAVEGRQRSEGNVARDVADLMNPF